MRVSSRFAFVTATAALAVFAFAGAAEAHVTVSSPGAVQGGSDQVITFRVPTESDTASTTGLRVQFPTDTALASVLVQDVAGWSWKVTEVKLATPIDTDDGPVTEAVGEVDWTATGDGIKPGGFGQFNVIVGQLPKTPSLTFKAIQHYSDNTDVSWVEVAAPGSAEPDHPAPALDLAVSATTSTGNGSSSNSTASESSVTVAIILGAVGIAVGAAGLIFAVTRRRPV